MEKIALVYHGRSKSKANESRLRSYKSALQIYGKSVDIVFADAHTDFSRYDVVHIFFCWRFERAIQTLCRAKKSGAKVIFSPLTSERRYIVYWDKAVPLKIAQNKNNFSNLKKHLSPIQEMTPSSKYEYGEIPIESGPRNYFSNLETALKLADEIVFTSEKERLFSESVLGRKLDNASVIHNFTMLPQAIKPDKFRKAYSLDKYILCTGKISKNNNQLLLALANESNLPIVFMGPVCDKTYFAEIQKCTGTGVYISPPEDIDLVLSAYAGAELFVRLNWDSNISIAPICAGYIGTPMLLSNLCEYQEYFGEYAEYVHPLDIQAIRDKINRIEVSPDPKEQRLERAAHVNAVCSPENIGKALCRVYEKPVSAKPDFNKHIYYDVTNLCDQFLRGYILTGVPRVEYNVLEELVSLNEVAQIIPVFHHSRERGYVQLDSNAVLAGNVSALREQIENGAAFLHLEINSPCFDSKNTDTSLSSELVIASKRIIQKLPSFPQKIICGCIRKFKPDFDCWKFKGEAHLFCSKKVKRERKSIHGMVLQYESVCRKNPAITAPGRLICIGNYYHLWQIDNWKILIYSNLVQYEQFVHDILYISHPYESNIAKERAIKEVATKACLDLSKYIYVSSNQVKREIEHYAEINKINVDCRVVGLGVDDYGEGHPGRYADYADKKMILYVGSIRARKNHNFISCVWRELYENFLKDSEYKNTYLVFIGKKFDMGSINMSLEELENINVRVLDKVTDENLAWFYNHCLFTVCPSFKEGWSMPVQESLAYGKPCISTETLPVIEEIKNEAIVLLPATDYFAWYKTLKELISDDSKRLYLEQEALKHPEHITWREVGRNIYFSKTNKNASNPISAWQREMDVLVRKHKAENLKIMETLDLLASQPGIDDWEIRKILLSCLLPEADSHDNHDNKKDNCLQKVLCKLPYNINVNCYKEDYFYRFLSQGQFYEEGNLQRFCGSRLKKNSIVYDIGANLGNHSLYFAVVKEASRVFAFEPQPHVFGLLCDNISSNWLEQRIIPFCKAAGSETGTAYTVSDKFYDDILRNNECVNTGDAQMFASPLTSNYVPVEIVPVDSLNLPKPGFIKIDVEDAELEVLKGLKQTIRSSKPFVWLESRNAEQLKAIIEYFSEMEYKLVDVFYDNYLFNHEFENQDSDYLEKAMMEFEENIRKRNGRKETLESYKYLRSVPQIWREIDE